MRIKPLTLDDVNIKVECMEEDQSPYEHFDDEITALAIDKELEYNPWAWFTAKVTVTHKQADFKSVQYLGCCSFQSEDEFKTDYYYKDMVDEAMKDIQDQMEEMFVFLCSKVPMEVD